ncbi:MAG TPA: OmpW family protein [Rickettsiales bacterium]|nr:OmpW family protein [Rickettsiales bacterium]
MNKIFAALLATTLISGSALAAESKDGNWLVRVRAIDVMPQVSSQLSIGGTVSVDNSAVPELDITHFFTPNIAAELILATTKHDLRTSSGLDAGSVRVLPPTLTMQYHFTQFNAVKPYIGAGVNYTVFYDAKPGVLNNVTYQDNFGAALQAGADFPIADNWYFNIDAKKLFLSTTAKFNNEAVRANVDLNPWIIGAGIGYRF